MGVLGKLAPRFWNHKDVVSSAYHPAYNFRRIWKYTVTVTVALVFTPLFLLALFDYNITAKAVESEIISRTIRFVSNTRRTISFFLEERRFALDFIINDHRYEDIRDPAKLAIIQKNLENSLEGFTDLGLVDKNGRQIVYTGPYPLEGKDYSQSDWFKRALSSGSYVSDVFLGFRNAPHLVITTRKESPDGSFFFLKASLDIERLKELVSELEISGQGDAFIINDKGVLQTPSKFYGDVLQKVSLPVPEYSETTEVFDAKGPDGNPVLIGYAYIKGTPFIFMVVKQKDELLHSWRITRLQLLVFVIATIAIILVVILGMVTFFVDKMYAAEQKRLFVLHQAEYANKMASIGRIAASVAHEINNPLAIINEKAGLIQDLFVYRQEYVDDPKLMGLVKSIIASVERCGAITKRLLNFARNMDVSVESIDLSGFFSEILSFMGKEIEYRSIRVNVSVDKDITDFQSDRGKLQQIFLNLINNAFAALSDDGQIEITAKRKKNDRILITVTDNGCGIPEENLQKIFEPFFSTKRYSGGTGLGLSITYNLVQELKGEIYVQSKVGEGSSFKVDLPLKP